LITARRPRLALPAGSRAAFPDDYGRVTRYSETVRRPLESYRYHQITPPSTPIAGAQMAVPGHFPSGRQHGRNCSQPLASQTVLQSFCRYRASIPTTDLAPDGKRRRTIDNRLPRTPRASLSPHPRPRRPEGASICGLADRSRAGLGSTDSILRMG
jgi:hypothetical protein